MCASWSKIGPLQHCALHGNMHLMASKRFRPAPAVADCIHFQDLRCFIGYVQVEAIIKMVMGSFTVKGGRSSVYLDHHRKLIAEYESTNGARGTGRWRDVLWKTTANGPAGASMHMP